jgi:hypothetical protein
MKCMVETCFKEACRIGYCFKHYFHILRYGKIKETTIKSPNEFIIKESYCEIVCRNSKGEIVGNLLIDLDDVDKCKQFKWCISYWGYGTNKGRLYLHKFIKPELKTIDHINRNKLDCRKENLRPANKSQNGANKESKRGISGYKGVKWSKDSKKWYAIIRGKNCKKANYLGLFETKEEAALAWNAEALKLWGDFAILNVVKPKLIKRRKHES